MTTGNIVLHRTIERIHVGDKFGDIPRGIFLIRGENMVLCGEVHDEETPAGHLVRVDVDEILELQQLQLTEKQETERIKRKVMLDTGLVFHHDADRDDF